MVHIASQPQILRMKNVKYQFQAQREQSSSEGEMALVEVCDWVTVMLGKYKCLAAGQLLQDYLRGALPSAADWAVRERKREQKG